MRALQFLLPLLTLVLGMRLLSAQVMFLPINPGPDLENLERDFSDPDLPGRGMPQAPAPVGIHVVIWGDDDEHRSYLVIPPGGETVRTATVFTMFDAGGPFGRYRVSYQGRVFVTADGAIDIDCRFSHIRGPEAGSWSPDSFRIGRDGSVDIVDDALRASPGRVQRVVRPETKRGPGQPHTYRELARIIQIRITGIM